MGQNTGGWRRGCRGIMVIIVINVVVVAGIHNPLIA